MASKDYSDIDYGTCRFIRENRLLDGTPQGEKAVISNAGLSLTVVRVKRLRNLRLVDGPEQATADGDLVMLSGLGVKTAAESVRLDIDAV